MQLGKKSKTNDMFERVRGDFGASAEDSAPLVSTSQSVAAEKAPSARVSTSADRDAIHVVVGEAISAKFDKEGTMKSFSVKGDLQLRISDPSLTRVKLDLVANPTQNAQFKTHPNVDKARFGSSKAIQLKDTSKGFPANTPVGVLRWTATAPGPASATAPITFTVWVNKGSDDAFTLTVEYELTGSDALKDVVVTIPYSTSEPAVSSFDAVYEVSGDSLEWTIGTVDGSNANGAFEFEAQAADEAEFFPMDVHFSKSKPFVDVDVSCGVAYHDTLLMAWTLGAFRCVGGDGSGRFIHEGNQVRCRLLHHRKGLSFCSYKFAGPHQITSELETCRRLYRSEFHGTCCGTQLT